MLAADVGTGQTDVVTQRVGEQATGGYGDVVRDAVHLQADLVELLAHAVILLAAATTRAVSTRTSWER